MTKFGLLDREATLLNEAGLPVGAAPDFKPLLLYRRTYQTLKDTGLNTKTAGARLHVSSRRIRQRLAKRELYGFRKGSEWTLPAFQFMQTGLVPNIGKVIGRLTLGLDPVAVFQWFTTPNLDLVDAAEPTSPLAWLSAGNNWKRVADMAADL